MRILIARNVIHSYLLGTQSLRGILSIYLLNKIRRDPRLQGFLTEAAFQDMLNLVEELKDLKAEQNKLIHFIKDTLHLLPHAKLRGILPQVNEIESEEITLALRNSLDALITHEPARYKPMTNLLVWTVSEFFDQYRRSTLNRRYLAQSIEASVDHPTERAIFTSDSSLRFVVFQAWIEHFIQELVLSPDLFNYQSIVTENVIFGNEDPTINDITNAEFYQQYKTDDLLNYSSRINDPGYELNDKIYTLRRDRVAASKQKILHQTVPFWKVKFDDSGIAVKENLIPVLLMILISIGLEWNKRTELIAQLQQLTLQEADVFEFNGLATIPVSKFFTTPSDRFSQQTSLDLVDAVLSYINLRIRDQTNLSLGGNQITAIADIADFVKDFSDTTHYFKALNGFLEFADTSLNRFSRNFTDIIGYINQKIDDAINQIQYKSVISKTDILVESETESNNQGKKSYSNTIFTSQNEIIAIGVVAVDNLVDSIASVIETDAQGKFSDDVESSNLDRNAILEIIANDNDRPASEYGELPNAESISSPPKNLVKIQVGSFDGPLSLGPSSVILSKVSGTGLLDSRSPLNDYLLGGKSNDTLLPGGGNDILNGDRGFDTLTGGRGADTFIIGYGVATITDFEANEGDRLEILGTIDDYTFTSSGSSTVIRVKNQTVARLLDIPVGQVVAIVEQTSSQHLSFSSRTINASLVGTAADDVIVGKTDSNVLSGRTGDDILVGAKGRSLAEFNLLTGGKGADTFVIGDTDGIFHSAGGFSTITDFDSKQGDKLILAGNPVLYSFEVIGSNTEIRMGKFSLYSGQLVGVVQNKQDLNRADIAFVRSY